MNPLPSVSVIMPVRDDAHHVSQALESVLAQDYPSDLLEILVAEGRSSDGTLEEVERTIAAHPHRCVQVLDNPSGLVPTGLNAALRAASGDVIVRVDGHCEIPPHYVRGCVSALRETGAANVGGPITTLGRTARGKAIAAAMSSPFGVGNAAFRYAVDGRWVDTVPFGAWRRELFEQIGHFDERLVRNQDDELNLRIHGHGGRIWLEPSLRTTYRPRERFAGLGRQYFEYGLYKTLVIHRHRRPASLRHLIPATFVMALGISGLASTLTRQRRWFGLVAGPYAMGLAAASVRAAPPNEPLAAPLIPAAFATMHLAYGFGFLTGLWRWRRDWLGP